MDSFVLLHFTCGDTEYVTFIGSRRGRSNEQLEEEYARPGSYLRSACAYECTDGAGALLSEDSVYLLDR